MKILQLTASNVKRLRAVEITPNGKTVIIGGKNRQGKSSVLDSISYALGGKALIPAEPIRKGEDAAEIRVDLGDIIVIRKFRRDDKEIKSTLFVTNREGLEYPSPQTVLNKLLGELTFDPLAFVDAESKEQVEMLRSVVNLDFTELNNERAQTYNERTLLNKRLHTETVKFDEMPYHSGVGIEIVPLDEITKQLETAKSKREEYDKKLEQVSSIQKKVDDTQRLLENRLQRIKELEAELLYVRKAADEYQESGRKYSHDLKVVTKERDALYAAIPNITAISARMSELNATNQKIAANQKKNEVKEHLKALRQEIEEKSNTIEEIDETKRKMIESIKFPVDGLGFDFEKNLVTLNGLPFEQASQAEQLSVSVAIGMAINPKLKVLLVKEGSRLDSEGLKTIAEVADKADVQLWIERVAESREGIGVMIEDGAVA